MPAKGSGVQTAADLQARCDVNEVTDCWHWTGALSDGHPRMWIWDHRYGKTRVVSGPRGAALIGGLAMHKGWRAWMTCGCKTCVNPEHVETGTTKQWGAWCRQAGVMKNNPRRRAAVRRRWAEESPENFAIAKAVRESAETGLALAARFNKSPQTISKMRNSVSWAPLVTVFSGLGAR